jgi:hypothetical protein
MSALSADRMQVVVLGMALFTKTGIIVRTPGAPFTVTSAGALGPLCFFVCNRDHRSTLGNNFMLLVWLSNSAMAGEYHKPVQQSWIISHPETNETAEAGRRIYQYN